MKMRVIFIIAVITTLPLSASAVSWQITADSKVSTVTVYGDRALVTRTARLNLRQGTNVVTFDNLPLQLAEETLRARGKGVTPARISGLTVTNVFPEKTEEKRLAELEEQIYNLELKIQKIDARRAALASQRAFIESIKVGWGERISRDLSTGKPVAGELGDAVRFIGEGINRVEDQLYDSNAEKKPLLDKIAALKNRLEQSRIEPKNEVRRVDVAVEAPESMELQIELSYLIEPASWEPAYDLRLEADGKSAELVYRAMIWQKSGEEWQDVNLSLSTATPSAGSSPPELRPWRISLHETPQPQYNQPRSFGKAAMSTNAPMAVEMLAPLKRNSGGDAVLEAEPLLAQRSEGETSVLFTVPLPVTVPSDGTRYGTVLAQEKVPVTAEYVTIPKLSQKVFLKSEVSNRTSYPLLPGSINTFNDGAFTGKAFLRRVAGGEKFDLFFGMDEQVKAKRTVTKVKKEAGILAGNRISWRCQVELENFKKETVSLTLLDQLPVAGNDEIKVSLSESEPRPDEMKQDGTLSWKLSIKPGEKRIVSYDIDLEYPKGLALVGAD